MKPLNNITLGSCLRVSRGWMTVDGWYIDATREGSSGMLKCPHADCKNTVEYTNVQIIGTAFCSLHKIYLRPYLNLKKEYGYYVED